MRRPLRLCALTGVLAVALASGGLAGAWLTTVADGTGSATTSGMQAVTVAALTGGDAPSTELVPGGTADVVLRVSNPNPYAVVLTSASGIGAVGVTGGVGACPSSGVTFTNQTGLAITIPASSDTLVHLAGAASMSATSPTGCQGATFGLPVAITVMTP